MKFRQQKTRRGGRVQKRKSPARWLGFFLAALCDAHGSADVVNFAHSLTVVNQASLRAPEQIALHLFQGDALGVVIEVLLDILMQRKIPLQTIEIKSTKSHLRQDLLLSVDYLD
ncbi:hypothetical protein [Pseudomonas sp.]|uniref:hypothetical protein n=1 Tax=Pseudomonas sp. TaxID=306 RepID=UPI0025FA39B4|nr:hypothetical protein [Pseudomonas sp.]